MVISDPSELNRDVARLQAELNAAKLQEFEAQETIVDLSSQLEEERNMRLLQESELKVTKIDEKCARSLGTCF